MYGELWQLLSPLNVYDVLEACYHAPFAPSALPSSGKPARRPAAPSLQVRTAAQRCAGRSKQQASQQPHLVVAL